MTVSYHCEVSSISSWSFFKLIFRWRGSIWKSVLSELSTWTFLFYVVFAVKHVVLDDEQRRLGLVRENAILLGT
ncbi:Protein BEST-8 [Aphelenchoides avenae]|nr:Protein BEST-8 [Aphelenchus avenae]